MNPRLVLRYAGLLVVVSGFAMVTALPVALAFGERDELIAVALSAAVSLAAGLLPALWFRTRRPRVTRRDAFAIVAVAWFAISAFGGLPYMLSGVLPNPVDAFFESASGFTTTGASVIADPDTVPRAILYWRALTQWLGGMGIIVLFVAVFAELGVGGRFLFQSEVPGPISESIHPKIRETSLALWKLYVLLTALLAGLLAVAGLDPFDAVCHAFTTLSTGGFSTRTAGVAAFDSGAVTWILIAFMIVAGTNFALIHQAFRGRFGRLARDRELWAYLALLALATVAVFADVAGRFDGPGQAWTHAAFQVTSLMTTTGFATRDFDLWPPFSKILLVVLMFVGGSAGSTAGGIKVIRLLMLFKVAQRGLVRLIRPHVVMPVRLGRQVIPEDAIQQVTGFFFLYMLVFVGVSLFVAAHGIDMATSLSSAAATLGNIGPGLARIGAVRNFADLPADVKAVLAVAMILGRLELYSVAALAVPVFWRR
ncbi:MAG TPA: TrkH family potassium uptake protein [Myxococcota bacterium]|nr:TrkH family potassium uptake protein [Myxococcota bacterium]